MVGPGQELGVAVEEVVLVRIAQGRILPRVTRKPGHVVGARSLCGFETAHVAVAGERREGGEVADDFLCRCFRRDPLLGLAAQHFGLRPVAILPQEAPGRSEIGIGLGSGAQDAPGDVTVEQRLAEIGNRRARIAPAVLVDGLESGGEGRSLGRAQRLGRRRGLGDIAAFDLRRCGLPGDRRRGRGGCRRRNRRRCAAVLCRYAPQAGVGGAGDGLIAALVTQILRAGHGSQSRRCCQKSQQEEGGLVLLHPGIVGRELGHHNGKLLTLRGPNPGLRVNLSRQNRRKPCSPGRSSR